MSEFERVSLGFAEFVGQLLNETFEATVEAQQHQLRRSAELEAALNLNDTLFLQTYVDQQTVLDKEMEIAGAPIARQMLLHDSVQAGILSLTEEYEEESIIYQNRLTNYGFESLREVIDEIVVEEQRARLNALISWMDVTRLVVDSGEINAKLELNTLLESSSSDSGLTSQQTPTKKRLDIKDSTIESASLNELSLSQYEGVKTYFDEKSKETTLLIDKSIVTSPQEPLPLRMTAKPLTTSTKSSVYSEVTIRFKTV